MVGLNTFEHQEQHREVANQSRDMEANLSGGMVC